MTRPAAALALAALLCACDSTGPTALGWPRMATKHGTVIVDPLADPVAVVVAIEAGFERARTRTREPSKLDGLGCEGWVVVVVPGLIQRGTYGRYLGPHKVEIAPDTERVLDHESQHLLADQLGIRGACLEMQDHGEHWSGGCSLDAEWARAQ